MRQKKKKLPAINKSGKRNRSPITRKAGSVPGRERRVRRPASEAGADELAIVAVALQHQTGEGGACEILSLSYSVRQGGKRTGGFIDLRGTRPLRLGVLIKVILDSAMGSVYRRYPQACYVVSFQTDLLLDWLKDGDKWREGLAQKGHTHFYRRAHLHVRRPTASGKYRDDSLWLVDSRNLGPDRDGVAELESWLGRPPSQSPAEGDWQSVYESDREEHERLAKSAADLLADFAHGIAGATHACIGTATLFATLGSLAEEFFIREVGGSGSGHLPILGKASITTEEGKRGTALLPSLHLRQTLATECYHGGRNESFCFGPTTRDDWTDYDLRSAYPTALASIGTPAWGAGFETIQPADFTHEAMGFARLRFEFPESVRFPVLPVRVSGKLIFPRSGECYATAPEIALALSLGADLTIFDGFVIPCNPSAKPYCPTIRKSVEHRSVARAADDTLAEKFHKAIANSIPGKMGQGLPPRHESDENSRRVPPCRITQPFLAAHVNGLIRAAVGEILNRLPESATVVSVTTDGFVTNAKYAQVAAACEGPLATTLSETRRALTMDPGILEGKGRARRILPIRNRVIATIEGSPGRSLILSRSGIRPPHEFRTREEKNRWLLTTFETRNPTLRVSQDFRRPDAAGSRKDSYVGLEYDFDRRLEFDSMQALGKSSHGFFRSRPWNSREDYLCAKAAFAEFRETSCLRTLEDLELFEEHLMIFQARAVGVRPIYKAPGSVLQLAHRFFLRALVRGELGLGPYQKVRRRELSQRINEALADLPNSAGLAASEDALKNAARPKSTYEIGVLPRTRRVEALFERLGRAFPGFTWEGLCAPASTECKQAKTASLLPIEGSERVPLPSGRQCITQLV